MKVLVTGANGFIGSALCRSLLASGFSVSGLIRETSDTRAIRDLADLELVRGDAADPHVAERATRNAEIVYHVAGLASDWGPVEAFRRSNVDAVRSILEAARRNGGRC